MVYILQVSTAPLYYGEESGASANVFPLLATKTYLTTSTYFTTYIDKSATLTKTRTKVRSRVVTETYSGGQFDYLPAPPAIKPSAAPLVRGDPEEKYLSLGPNIYGLVKTFYATYTYLTTDPQGQADQSLEVITQVSTSFFSTTSLPASIQVAGPPASAAIQPTAALQLDKDSLLTIKDSHVSDQGHVTPDITASYTQVKISGDVEWTMDHAASVTGWRGLRCALGGRC